jgi:hypothetical protein
MRMRAYLSMCFGDSGESLVPLRQLLPAATQGWSSL